MAEASKLAKQHQIQSVSATNASVVPKKHNRYQSKPSKRSKAVKIAQSQIPNAGSGLYIIEDAKKGEFVARYSGEAINKIENESRTNYY